MAGSPLSHSHTPLYKLPILCILTTCPNHPIVVPYTSLIQSSVTMHALITNSFPILYPHISHTIPLSLMGLLGLSWSLSFSSIKWIQPKKIRVLANTLVTWICSTCFPYINSLHLPPHALIFPTPSLPLVSLHRPPVAFHIMTIVNDSIINSHSFCSLLTLCRTFL